MIPQPARTRFPVRALVATAAAAVSVLTAGAGTGSATVAPAGSAVQAAAPGDTVTINNDAYWLISVDGSVHTFGGVASFGSLPTGVSAVDLEPAHDDQGYWILG